MKGALRTAIERARWAGGDTIVQFRDRDHLVEVPFNAYWDVADIIPEGRIARVIQNGVLTFVTSKQDMLSLPVVKQAAYEVKDQ